MVCKNKDEIKLRKKAEEALARGIEEVKKMKRLLFKRNKEEQDKSHLQAKPLEQKNREKLPTRKNIKRVKVKLEKLKFQFENLCTVAKEYKHKAELMILTKALTEEKQEHEKAKGLIESYKVNANKMRKERDNALELVSVIKTTMKIKSFLCPISHEVMKDPQMTSDGYTYEGKAIRKWFEKGHDTSPMTNLKLSRTKLIPNRALRSAIQELV